MRFKKTKTRFAPSPTGVLHIGSVRSALYPYLYARKNNGTFILRIEDTDKERSTTEFETQILESLKWLGLEYDEIFKQSERSEIYTKYLQQLIDGNKAYISNEEKGSVIRFKNPNTTISFTDEVVGTVSMDISDLGDFVLAKDMQTPLFHLAVVVDDFEMEVTHVIRGADHLSNTPRQVAIHNALGIDTPIYAHIPLVMAADKTKLSKRHGALPVLQYRDLGYVSDAILNFLALIGWTDKEEKEIFTLSQLVDSWSLERVHRSPGVFNPEKLDWVNKQHIAMMSSQEFEKFINPFLLLGINSERFTKSIPLIKERISYGAQMKELETGEFHFLNDDIILKDSSSLVWKTSNSEETILHLKYILKILDGNDVEDDIMEYAKEKGMGNVLWPLRYSLTGQDKSPGPIEVLNIIGNEEARRRIQKAIESLT